MALVPELSRAATEVCSPLERPINAMKLQSLPCYCATLRQTARAVTALYEEVLGESGLHATQYTTLQVLKQVPNLTTTELADAIGIDQTTATRTLALIRKSGLAIDTSGGDRREKRWVLTAAGETTYRSLRPKWEADAHRNILAAHP